MKYEIGDKIRVVEPDLNFFFKGDVGVVVGGLTSTGGYRTSFNNQGNPEVCGDGIWYAGNGIRSVIEKFKPEPRKKGIRFKMAKTSDPDILEIISISALRKDQLPVDYTIAAGSVYMKKGEDGLYQRTPLGEVCMLIPGKIRKDTWGKALNRVKDAGNMLMEVNKKISETFEVVV